MLEVKAKIHFTNGTEADAIAVNPGDWFGKIFVLGIAIANALNPLLVIEADTLQDAIDELADSKYGHLINDDTPIDQVDEDNATYAGNDSHLVNLDNVSHVTGIKSIDYYVTMPASQSSNFTEVFTAVENINKEEQKYK